MTPAILFTAVNTRISRCTLEQVVLPTVSSIFLNRPEHGMRW